jgi:hypothetical protein
MIWSSLIGTIIAIVGIVVAVWMYSPRQKYKLAGKATGIPYRGQKRWHWILGMVFGVATVTWTFSGLLSLGPFPLVQRLTQTGPPAGQRGQQQQPQQVSTQEQEPAQQAPSDAARGVSVPEVTGAQAGSPRGGRQVGQRESLALYRLHSLNFPFLYNHRPLWDIVVITFMIGGTALCVTLLVLAWRVLGRKLKRAAAPADDVLTLEA